MKKTIAFIIAILACCALFCGCTSDQPQQEEVKLPSRFVVISDDEMGYASSVQKNPSGSVLEPATYGELTIHYVVDRETRVVYMFYHDKGMFLSPLFNADGTPVIYEGELPYSGSDEIA